MPRSFLFVLVLLSLSLGLNVKLAWQVKATTSPPQHTKVGVQVPSFSATDLEGHTADLSFNTGKPTLIYYIDPECRWCKANAASFSTLAHLIGNKVQVMVLSKRAEKMGQFLAESHSPEARVLIINSQRLIHDLSLTGTPQTFFVGATGRVEHHWLGAYSGHNRTDIEKTFDVHLPDVSPSS